MRLWAQFFSLTRVAPRNKAQHFCLCRPLDLWVQRLAPERKFCTVLSPGSRIENVLCANSLDVQRGGLLIKTKGVFRHQRANHEQLLHHYHVSINGLILSSAVSPSHGPEAATKLFCVFWSATSACDCTQLLYRTRMVVKLNIALLFWILRQVEAAYTVYAICVGLLLCAHSKLLCRSHLPEPVKYVW